MKKSLVLCGLLGIGCMPGVGGKSDSMSMASVNEANLGGRENSANRMGMNRVSPNGQSSTGTSSTGTSAASQNVFGADVICSRWTKQSPCVFEGEMEYATQTREGDRWILVLFDESNAASTDNNTRGDSRVTLTSDRPLQIKQQVDPRARYFEVLDAETNCRSIYRCAD